MFESENPNIPLMSDEGIQKLMLLYSSLYKEGKYFSKHYVTNIISLSTDKNSSSNDLKYFYEHKKEACIKEVISLLNAMEEDIRKFGIDEYIEIKKRQSDSPELLNCLNIHDIYSVINFPKDMIEKRLQNDEISVLPKLVQFLYKENIIFDEMHAGLSTLPFIIDKDVFDIEHNGQGKKRFRIYLNNPTGKEGIEFYSAFLKRLIEKRVPYSNKFNYNKVEDRKDKSIFYFPIEYLSEVKTILDDIQMEYPNIISKFGTPPTSCGQYSYFGVSHTGAGINVKNRTYNMFINDVTSMAYFIYFCKQVLMHRSIFSKMNDDEKKVVMNYAQGVKNNLVCMEITNKANFNDSTISSIVQKYGNLFLVAIQPIDYRNILKQVVSMKMYGDLDHVDYPICFNDYFYDVPLSNAKKM